MRKSVLSLLSIFFLFSLTSCVTTGFKKFYEPWHGDSFFPETSYLQEGETPEIIKTYDITTGFREVASQWYWCIGSSGFNGEEISDSEIQKALSKLCVEKKARVAIYSKSYTDTRSGAISVPYTNYHYYTGAGGYLGSYTTTSYNSIPYSIERYDFYSYLFVKIPDEYREIYAPGISTRDLTQKEMDENNQNTGVAVNIVYRDSQAFFANLSHGDIITKINGTPIYSHDDFDTVKLNTKLGDAWNMTIVRSGQERQISLIYR